jgi:hypothetical protein
MKRSIAMALLVCTSVFSHRFLLAQQDQAEVERKVLSKVAPTYPNLARKTNIHGAVKLGVVIGPDGRVESTKVIGRNPLEATWRVQMGGVSIGSPLGASPIFSSV